MEKATEHIYFKDFSEFLNNNKGQLVKTVNHIDDEFTDIVYTKGQGEFIVTKQLVHLDNQKLRLYVLDEIFEPEVKIYSMRVVYRQGFTEKYYFKLFEYHTNLKKGAGWELTHPVLLGVNIRPRRFC